MAKLRHPTQHRGVDRALLFALGLHTNMLYFTFPSFNLKLEPMK